MRLKCYSMAKRKFHHLFEDYGEMDRRTTTICGIICIMTLADMYLRQLLKRCKKRQSVKKGCSFCNDKRVVSFCATSYHSSLEPITVIEDLYFGFCPHCGRKLGENK